MADLYGQLKRFRLERAKELEQPAFCVFGNKVLDAIVSTCPQNLAQLSEIKGMGPAKMQKFGSAILALCAGRSAPSPLSQQAINATANQSRPAPPRVKIGSEGQSWTEAADKWLWSNKDRPVAELARHFDRKDGGIRARLKHLQDPAHAAYRRLHQESWRSHPLLQATPESSPNKPTKRPRVECEPVTASNQPQISTSSLNAGQAAAAGLALGGQSCFLTGPAGSGKSFLLNYVIQELLTKWPSTSQVAVTAPTGIAATHIHGVTIHSWAGIGLGTGSFPKLLQRVQSSAKAVARWKAVEVLVLDEVSMLNSHLLDCLEAIAREVRGSSAPFGGIQLILCGDFYQLPPVNLGQCGTGFAFEAAAWKSCRIRTVQLRTVVRQAGDDQFCRLLNEVRVGLCSHATTEALNRCHVSVKPVPVDGILPTKLYCTNANVDKENLARLSQLPGMPKEFVAIDTFKGGLSEPEVGQQLRGSMDKKAPGLLPLKPGAQVIFTKNESAHRLVNGSRGIVIGFESAVDPATQTQSEFPRVKFDNGQQLVVTTNSFFQAGRGGALVRRQLPLKLAWALTVHKSQGMTLSRAELMLANAFDYGQVYVGLSRVRSLAGTWIRGGSISQAVVKAHPTVIQFYQSITQ